MTKEELLTEDINLKAEIRTENMAYSERKHRASVRHRDNLNTEHARYDEERQELEQQHEKTINGYQARRDEISLELAKMRIADGEAG